MVQVPLLRHQQAAGLEVRGDLEREVRVAVVGGARVAAALPAVAIAEDAELVDRVKHGQPVHLCEREVLLAAAGSDVHDAGPLLIGDLAPADDAVLHSRLHRQLVERAAVGEADELGTRCLAEHARSGRDTGLRAVGDPPATTVATLDQQVGQLRVDRSRDIAGKGPGGRGPDQQVLAFVARSAQRETDGERQVTDLAVALRGDLHV